LWYYATNASHLSLLVLIILNRKLYYTILYYKLGGIQVLELKNKKIYILQHLKKTWTPNFAMDCEGSMCDNRHRSSKTHHQRQCIRSSCNWCRSIQNGPITDAAAAAPAVIGWPRHERADRRRPDRIRTATSLGSNLSFHRHSPQWKCPRLISTTHTHTSV